MFLLGFAIVFIIVNIIIWKRTQSILLNDYNTVGGYRSFYIPLYIKGTVRGILGKFETNASIEEKRLALNKKNTKF